MIVYTPNGERVVAPSDLDRRTVRRLRRAAVRAEMDRARQYGLQARHQQKLRRSRAGEPQRKESSR